MEELNNTRIVKVIFYLGYIFLCMPISSLLLHLTVWLVQGSPMSWLGYAPDSAPRMPLVK